MVKYDADWENYEYLQEFTNNLISVFHQEAIIHLYSV